MAPRTASLGQAAIADAGRAITMALGGALAFAPAEFVATLSAYPGTTSVITELRLAALTATLSAFLFILLALALIAVAAGTRVVRVPIDRRALAHPGWFVPSPVSADGIRPGVPNVWGAVGSGLVLVVVVQRIAVLAMQRFKEPQLTAGLIAIAALGVVLLAPILYRALSLAATLGARGLAPMFGVINPLGRWRAAGFALAGVTGAALAACWFALPQSRSVLPIRLVCSAVAIALGCGLGALAHERARRSPAPRGMSRRAIVRTSLALLGAIIVWRLLPWSLPFTIVRAVLGAGLLVVALTVGSQLRRAPRSRARSLTVAITAFAVIVSTLLWWGAELQTKYVAITASPALEKLISLVRVANDLDRDGFGTVLGEADCAPFERKINPGALDKPDDGIDQNCDGKDFSLSALQLPTGPTMPVPAQFKKPWNVLLITVDTVRYDRTSFGGYKTGPKQRDTTPRLAELVARSTSFAFANAPSAGTMASIPAILTSKFFHSGIAISADRPGQPPKVLPENTLLPEIMKRQGYRTGVIGSHEYWNDWGLDQGVDDYDNSIGKTGDPFRVAADKVTDHALAWISRNQGQRWFLWAHYIDPHGRYVAHPDVADYGSSESDLYDAELRWTDQQLGRLFDELRRLPSNANTIIVVTSDHGDSMAEHNVPLGTHGTALYREMLHVPLIIYVPDNVPRLVDGAVSPLDVVPTIAELCGIDVSDLSFEGRSLVPQVFAGRADLDRIVFAETNAGQRQRAAVSRGWKLIYYLQSNITELYDLAQDPWEKTNLAPNNPPALVTMRQALQAWMERVLYARDPVFNQAFRQAQDLLVPEAPPIASSDQSLAD